MFTSFVGFFYFYQSNTLPLILTIHTIYCGVSYYVYSFLSAASRADILFISSLSSAVNAVTSALILSVGFSPNVSRTYSAAFVSPFMALRICARFAASSSVVPSFSPYYSASSAVTVFRLNSSNISLILRRVCCASWLAGPPTFPRLEAS